MKHLTLYIIVALVVGTIIGVILPEWAVQFKIMSEIFLRMIKMIIAPLVLSTLASGVSKLGQINTVGRIGLKTMLYFYGATIVSLSFGLLLANFFEPGSQSLLTSTTFTIGEKDIDSHLPSFSQFLVRIIPTSVIDALAKNEILPIVVFSIFLGLSISAVGKKGEPMGYLLESLSEVMLTMTQFVMYFAPIGVLGAMAGVVGSHGLGVFQSYFYILILFYAGLLAFVFVGLGGICKLFKIPFFEVVRASKDAILIAFSTASSESAFPRAMETLDKLGCPPKISGFVLPLGYSFNLDASMMYMTFATLFLAQSYGIALDWTQQGYMVLLLLLASKGIAGVPRASLVIVAGLLQTFGIPGEGLLLLLGIDHLLDMGRSAVNMLGNVVAACVITKWERKAEN